MLKELKTLGVKDDLLYGLINRAKIDEAVVTHHGPLIFTQHRLINTKLGRCFEFEGGAAVVATIDNRQHGHSNVPHAVGQAIKHPTPFWLIVAAFTAFVESAESASPKPEIYTVDLVKTSGVRYRMLDSCPKDEMVEIEKLSALVGLPFSVEVKSDKTK
jgi:hypothetical protein